MRRRRGFGYGSTPRAIKEETRVAPKKQKCSGCTIMIQPGETAYRFMLSKKFRMLCPSCMNEPRRSRWYHLACRPSDVNKAMGYTPKVNIPPVAAAPSAAPPLPKTAHELKLDALVAMEAAFKRRLAEQPTLQSSAELEKALKTYNGCKAHVLRPGAPNEGFVALKQALKRVVDLVF